MFRSFLLALTIIAPVACDKDALADSIPVSGPLGYYSSDPAPVIAKLENKLDDSRSITMRVPRSAVLFVSDFNSKDVPRLPESFTVSGILRFALTYPDAVPFGEAVERWRIDHGDSLSAAASALRPARTMADVRLIKPETESRQIFFALFNTLPGFEPTEAPPFEGLKATELRKRGDASIAYNDDVLFYGDRLDFFDYIQCSRSNKQATVFCNYYLRVNDRAAIKATFVDFRFNGGREVATERMRMLVRSFCAYSGDAESPLCIASRS